MIFENLGTKDYKRSFVDYLVIKLLPKSKEFNALSLEYMFEHFLKTFDEIKDEIP